MKKLIYSSILLSCLMLLQCAENSDTKPGDTLPKQDKSWSEIKSVCDCFDNAINTLNDALLLRNKYQNMEDFQKNTAAVKQMKVFIKRWHDIQKHCLMTYGSKMFTDKECNRSQELSDKRAVLKTLGIKT